MSAVRETSEFGEPGQHVIGSLRGPAAGPTLVVIGGIHGNEPAGARAARLVLEDLRACEASLRGEVLFLSGNTRALARGVRYIDADLNRHWTPANIEAARENRAFAHAASENLELRELLEEFRQAGERARGELYFLDLHTTSAHGTPFATIGDTLRNRRFAMNFPVPIVLGLEEQLEGTMLEYVNHLGAITLGFEAGQHEAEASIANHEAVLRLALMASGVMRPEDVPGLAAARAGLAAATGGRRIVEVRHRHAITPADQFTMESGYQNFQPVRRGQLLARDRRGQVMAREKGMVLLPLYQTLGDDGFFLGRQVKPFWLTLSAALRRLRVGDYAHLLPGVRRDRGEGGRLEVDTRIARFVPLQFFHLLGYRRLRREGQRLIVSRRPYDLAGPAGKERMRQS